MPGGYTGKLLNVDLTQGTVSIDHPDEKLLRRFIGGAGLGARVLQLMADGVFE